MNMIACGILNGDCVRFVVSQKRISMEVVLSRDWQLTMITVVAQENVLADSAFVVFCAVDVI